LLIGASLGEIAGGDTGRFGALAAGTALLVAAIAFVAWLAKAGVIVNFISESVMAGFKSGVALFLASTQLPKLFGYGGSHGSFWQNSGHFLRHLDETNHTSLLVGGTALAVIACGKVFFKNKPVGLLVVIGGIIASSLFSLDQRGVALLGTVPTGLPALGLPALHWRDLNDLLPLALACFLLAAVETSAIGRMFAARHGYRLDATQEFLAIGAANFVSALGSGYPVSGGMSQSLVNETAGARTPLSGLVAAVITLLVALFLTGLLRTLPQPVLAAIILVAVTGLVDVHKLRELWRFSRSEFAVAAAAFMGVLGSGLLQGVLIGVAISMMLLIRRASRPRVVEVGRVRGTSFFADLTRHPENERVPGVIVIRPEGSLLYFNAQHVLDRVRELVAKRAAPPRLVILFMGNVPFVDMSGAELLTDLQRHFARNGIGFRLAESRGEVREALRRIGGSDASGFFAANETVADILASA